MLLDSIFKLLPNGLQNLIITAFSFKQNRKRYGKEYYKYREYLKEIEYSSADELDEIQNKMLIDFLTYCKENSPHFQKVLKHIDVSKGKEILSDIPVCAKEEFRSKIPEIVTGEKQRMFKAKTGGTTGNSMQVYFRWDDFQERYAILDHFRSIHGYKIGCKTAWFSGKDLLNMADIKKNRFWRHDKMYNVRYYSTFDISEANLKYYIQDLNKFQPEFLVGFPSSIYEIARYGIENNFPLNYKAKAIFPTAETRIQKEVNVISNFFGCEVRDQYGSSEGACMITECEKGSMHLEVTSGIIEVVDDKNEPAEYGRMLITAFQTRGTPLIRYDIGDILEWASENHCACGRNSPIVKAIHGRINDFLYSKEKGKCNLGNLSNCVKNVKGVRRFQAIQDQINEVKILVETTDEYTKKYEEHFLKELRLRLGNSIKITFTYPESIPREKSGKFRIVKNNIKELV